MKKIIASALAVFMLASAVGCNKKHVDDDITPSVDNEVKEEIRENEFYTAMKNSTARPIAVMIDNDADYSGPHAGLENAYLIYEIYVEGGSTRMMALFNPDLMTEEEKETKIGPVRSSRHYFLDFAIENDAIYAHCGFSPQAQSEISSRNVNNINGLYESAPFFRYSDYNSSWHNLYTSAEKLEESAKGHGYSLTTDYKLSYLPNIEKAEDGATAENISIPYLIKGVSYSYDEDTGLYTRFKKGSEHTMQSGVTLTAQNIVILRMDNYDLNDGTDKGRQNLSDTGSGKGTYISSGKYVDITWKKSDRSASTELYYENGEKVSLNPGVTFIQIVPSSMNVTIE